MNRLQKKCAIASTGIHLLLLVVLLVGPGFLSRKAKDDDMVVLDFLPSMTTDDNKSGGGNPNAKSAQTTFKPPQPAPAQPVAVQPPPTRPPDPKPETQPDPEPPKRAPKVTPAPVEPEGEAKPAETKRHLPNVSTTPVRRTVDAQKAARAKEAARAAQEAADRSQKFADAARSMARSLRDSASGATEIEMPGPGGGGETYANYALTVKSIYANAWDAPDDTASDEAIAKVSVTIARDGNVISSEIVKSSGDAATDRSVQRTLDRVRFVAPFPPESKDKQRTFKISFNLKAKRGLG